MKKISTALLFAGLSIAALQQNTFAQGLKTTGFVQFLPDYYGKIELTETHVTVYLNSPADRWCAIGFDAQSMTPGTDVLFYADGVNGDGIYDGYLFGFGTPQTDDNQNWELVSKTLNGFTRELIVTRTLTSGDAEDYVFDYDLNALNIIFAHGTIGSLALSYHGPNRGITTLQFEDATACLVDGGTISTFSPRLNLCKGDGQPDYIQLSVSGNNGIGRYGLVRQSDLEIIATNNNGFFNMESYDAGQYYVGHISVANLSSLSGITNVDQLSGCFDLSNALPVTSFPLFGGALTLNGPSTVCDGNVSVSLTGNQGPISLFALLNEFSNTVLGSNTTGVFDFTPLANGIYRIVHISTIPGINLGALSPPFLPPCITPSNLVTIIKDSCGAASITTSPNPAVGISIAQFSVPVDYNATLEVFDLSGRRVSMLFNQEANKDQLYRVEFDTSNLSPGIYIYKFTAGNEILVEKIIVSK
jgi:hypothetical protein